ncbi:MAG: hypothetical protein U1C70_01395 [Sediminibacterium sp.]|jgi:hypothetical protein|uniref:hypothetical protein n=1 Tax=Sediminibacterium sp. TaxID=1917865 RepID=UPI002ABA325E|nr:hypothetical protein [Sediminibacterium sp.]MDZ4070452.1 hypothetical protein [Sediminibacterium sp.]
MKRRIIISFASIALLFTACKNSTGNKTDFDPATLTKEVTGSENALFSLLKEGKINDAFAMHTNNAFYRNIVDGISRTHSQMDSVLKSNASKNVKSYDYSISTRDFLIIDNSNVLETVEANRKLINTADSTIESKPVTLSILWTKDNTKWNVSYLHSSYKLKNN